MGIVNVVVICNGESVLEHEYGPIIDKFDCVVRMGEFKIKGFEKHIGKKTDVIINRMKQTYDETCVNPNTDIWSPHKIKENEKILHTKYINETKTNKIKYVLDIDTPTTGLFAYYLVEEFIPEKKKIYYHGMDFHLGGEYWDKEHSHAKIALKENVNHEPFKERLWFNKMVIGKKIFKLTNYHLF